MGINDHRLLVVGGSGFIGQHIVKKALKKGFNVTILTKNKHNATNNLNDVVYLTADISSKTSMLPILEGKVFDYVINLGGYINHANYSNGGSEVYDVHFNGVRNLVDCLDRHKIKGFVQIGSSDEYGSNPAPQSEVQREAPNSLYSCAKVSATYFLQTLYKTEGFPAIILRPFLVYGPGQGEGRFIPEIIKGCLNNQKFPASKGRQLRDFCFVNDFVQAVFFALNSDNAYGEVINIASGKPISIEEVVNKIINIVHSGRPQFGQIPYRNGENMELYANISKANSMLDWQPKTSLDNGLKITIDSYT